jgi:hypothetical protein
MPGKNNTSPQNNGTLSNWPGFQDTNYLSPAIRNLSSLKPVKVAAPVPRHPPESFCCFRLSKIGYKRHHTYYDEPDAHQIVEDLGKNHHDDTEDEGNDSSNET